MTSRIKILRTVALCSVIGLWSGLSGIAQEPTSSEAALAAIQAFEGPSTDEYTLGPGDQISVMVVGHAEDSGKQTVGPDGMITLPSAGSVKVSEMTRTDAAAAIEKTLQPLYTSPITVMVGVDVYNSNSILVFGAVDHPGLMQLEGPMTLLSVVTRAGTLAQTSTVIQGKLLGVPERVMLFRGNKRLTIADFKRALDRADPRLQMRLKKNDVVYIPSGNEQYVMVFGEVLHPGLVQLQGDSTVAQLIAEAGGIVTDRSGRYPKIQIVHEAAGHIDAVDFGDILKIRRGGMQPLESGDIIYVPESKFSRFSISLQKISPLISIATVAALIGNQ